MVLRAATLCRKRPLRQTMSTVPLGRSPRKHVEKIDVLGTLRGNDSVDYSTMKTEGSDEDAQTERGGDGGVEVLDQQRLQVPHLSTLDATFEKPKERKTTQKQTYLVVNSNIGGDGVNHVNKASIEVTGITGDNSSSDSVDQGIFLVDKNFCQGGPSQILIALSSCIFLI